MRVETGDRLRCTRNDRIAGHVGLVVVVTKAGVNVHQCESDDGKAFRMNTPKAKMDMLSESEDSHTYQLRREGEVLTTVTWERVK